MSIIQCSSEAKNRTFPRNDSHIHVGSNVIYILYIFILFGWQWETGNIDRISIYLFLAINVMASINDKWYTW